MTKLSELIRDKPFKAIGYVFGGLMVLAALLALIVGALGG
jgi:hypothetical protein